MATYSFKLAYNGANYAGFAKQGGGVTTVQGTVDAALAAALRLPDVPTVCAGRTDAGVHAAGQVVSFEVGSELTGDDLRTLMRSLNALTPPDIAIRDLRREHDGFSARFDARARHYCYRIACGATPPVFSAAYAWHVPRQPDVQAMQQAARHLVGEHDFRSFCVATSARMLQEDGRSTCRRVDSVQVADDVLFGEPLLTIDVTGNAFLHSMVRVMVGTLVEVGLGRMPADAIPDVLAAGDRRAAGPTAPAHGLMLVDVTY
ncbi:MAG: tRNA pseudouridine(38-40) synthase TruA [Actinomycetes bacterium]|jgi:tRNA pseudouridine38-40 synthase|nr:tRNA pseudouridine(38-40) synthase TruA [Actinomycetes bacterium]